MDLSRLSSEQVTRVNQIVASVAFDDTNSLLTFGADAQQALSAHLDELLTGLRTNQTGRAGEITLALATTLKDLNLTKVQAEIKDSGGIASALGKLPVVGGWFSALRALHEKSKEISDHLDAILRKAQSDMVEIRSWNDKLDRLVENTIEHIQNLELYMAAGQIIIKRARVEFQDRRDKALETKNVLEITRLRDFAERLNAFEARVVRVHLGHTRSIVVVPEIRTTQTAAFIEMNNLMDSILFDLPDLKSAIIRVAALGKIANASHDTQMRRDLRRELDGIASDQLQTTYLAAKESQGDFAADVAALAQSADKLLETIRLGEKIDEANAQKRVKALEDLSGLNTRFKEGLIEAGNRFVSPSSAQ
ncbi:toxic anion resistance protein [Trinickia fusca]|nr:toxic anion resistance protein [Trinickia fusca]